jgi:hypothetical protein
MTEKNTPLVPEESINFVLLPMTSSLGGRTQVIDLKVLLKASNHKEATITIKNVLALIQQVEYDFSHLITSHEESLYILIINNQGNWNNEVIWYRSGNGSMRIIK